ncbi:hypothetical protein QUA13_32095 [Microcoleus sp. S28C3]|uniref:hypothetical protein n=1 Tax=Microcoleus sp. S28C3 TaxID=3055414 RepID=UPI002FD313F7
MRKKYIVRLSDDERSQLQTIIKTLKGSASKVKRANILLKADIEGKNWTDQQIAQAFLCCTKTVENIRPLAKKIYGNCSTPLTRRRDRH